MSARLLDRLDEILTPQAAAGGIELLVRALIREVAETADPSPLAEPEESGVLLDTEVDGVRCLLVRLRPPPAAAEDAAAYAVPAATQIILSPREQEIARMVAAGYPNKTIAAVLDISSWTVGTHLRRVFAKLGVGSRAAMVARLLEENLLSRHPRPAEHPDPPRK